MDDAHLLGKEIGFQAASHGTKAQGDAVGEVSINARNTRTWQPAGPILVEINKIIPMVTAQTIQTQEICWLWLMV